MVDDARPQRVRPGDTVFIPKGAFHSTINTGYEPMVDPRDLRAGRRRRGAQDAARLPGGPGRRGAGALARVIVREERPEDRDAVRRVEEARVRAPRRGRHRRRAARRSGVGVVAGGGARRQAGRASAVHARRPRDDARAAGGAAAAPAIGCRRCAHGAGLARIDEPIVLLGHVDYYTRFGFRPAAPEGITNQWGIDDPAWMVRGDLAPGRGQVPGGLRAMRPGIWRPIHGTRAAGPTRASRGTATHG